MIAKQVNDIEATPKTNIDKNTILWEKYERLMPFANKAVPSAIRTPSELGSNKNEAERSTLSPKNAELAKDPK